MRIVFSVMFSMVKSFNGGIFAFAGSMLRLSQAFRPVNYYVDGYLPHAAFYPSIYFDFLLRKIKRWVDNGILIFGSFPAE